MLPRTREPVDTLDAQAGRLLERAQAAGSVQGVVTWNDLLPLMCGIAYAAGVHADGQEERLASGRRYLGVMLRGLRS